MNYYRRFQMMVHHDVFKSGYSKANSNISTSQEPAAHEKANTLM